MADKMKKCKYCRSEIDKKAKVCPVCRKKQSGLGDALACVLVALMIIIFVPAIIGACSKRSAENSSRTAEIVSSDPAAPEKDSQESQAEQVQEEAPKVPKDYSNALKKAERYADNMHMSKAGIYDQLTSEYGEAFSAEAATYAIENMTADFKENALYKAKRYSDNQHMSKAGIYDQLTSEYGEQFTADEAQYAVDNLVADYKDNALQKARSYQDSMAMSPNAIYEQLISEYGEQFTEEEAQYAIDNLN